MTDDEARISEFMQALFKDHDDRQEAIERLHTALVDRDLLARVTLHRYQCASRSCQIATVFRVDGLTLCAVRDYKLSPGMNESKSVPEARANRTLDGNRHWPAHVYDVEELARFSAGAARAGLDMNCPHFTGTILAEDILAAVAGVRPGHRRSPTRLGS